MFILFESGLMANVFNRQSCFKLDTVEKVWCVFCVAVNAQFFIQKFFQAAQGSAQLLHASMSPF